MGDLTIDDLVSMPHLGLELLAGGRGRNSPVLWTHVSELSDPGPWLEGGELLIVNGFGIPEDPAGQVDYVARLAHHRVAGIAISVKAPDLSPELLAEADRLGFPVLSIPREVPFVQLSHLVANASERSAQSRVARHLRIFEALRFRNSLDVDAAEVYSQLELASGYRLAVVSPAGSPLLPDWPWVPDLAENGDFLDSTDEMQMIVDGYVIPLFVDNRVTAYLIGKEHPDAEPGGLTALQHVSTIAVLDAIDDQRRREAEHRQGSSLFARSLRDTADEGGMGRRYAEMGLPFDRGVRILAFGAREGGGVDDIVVRDWLADRGIPHLLLQQGELLAVVGSGTDEIDRLAEDLVLRIGVSATTRALDALPRARQQALWALRLSDGYAHEPVVLAEQQIGLAQWLNPDADTLKHLADETLLPIIEHDAERNTDLLHTLLVYFQSQGRLRTAAGRLFVHEHTLTYRLKRIEQLTGRSLKSYRDAFELWLAVETHPLLAERRLTLE